MRRILITLILSIIVFVGTIVTTNIYVSNKSMQFASNLNNMMLNNLRSEIDGDVKMTEQSVRSFLSGLSFMSVTDKNKIIIDEKHLKEFKEDISDNLLQFMKANKYYRSSIFIFDADINHDYFNQEGCYAPCIHHGDSVLHILSDKYNFMRSPNYQQVKNEGTVLWTVPSSSSPVAGKCMTLYMPINLSNGRFFGAFAVSLDVQMINAKLKKHLPYGEDGSGIFISDEHNHIFAFYPQWIMNYKDDYENALNSFSNKNHTDSSLKYEYEGKEYYGFNRPTNLVPWTIGTICEEDKIYEEADYVKKIIFFTSFFGMILMLLCCVVISRQIHKDLSKKAAAEEELRMAANVQKSMLRSPQTPNGGIGLNACIKPAKMAGGDLYDYIEKDGKLIFCIGDVSGKGMPAALFMTQAVSLFRNAVRNTTDPAEITSQINDVLSQNNPDMTFCTFFVGVLEGSELRFCNAGHNPPVILPQRLGTQDVLSSYDKEGNALKPFFMKIRPNLALGLMEDYPYKAEVTQLNKDESILLYTDGITEAKNSNHEEFGEIRLLETLSRPSDKTLDTVLTAIHSFVGDYEQSDDITLLLVEP